MELYYELCTAIREKQVPEAKLLIDSGVSVNSHDPEEDAPIHLAIKYDIGLETIQCILEHGADLTAEDEDGNSPLMLAVEQKNIPLVKMLLEYGADVFVVGSEGSSPLHLAVSVKDLNLVEVLLEGEVFLDIQDRSGRTPLHIAAKNGCDSIVKLLLIRGADLHEVDRHGKTPLHLSALNGYSEIVCRLIDYEADVNVKDNNGRTCLHDSAWLGHVEVVKILLNCNANLDAVDREGFSALHQAAIRGHEETIQELLEHGADLSIKDKTGRTPLHHVILRGDYDMIKMFIECSDDLSTPDNNNLTPLATILSGIDSTTNFALNKQPDLIELLIKHAVRVEFSKSRATPELFSNLKHHLSSHIWEILCMYCEQCVREIEKISSFTSTDEDEMDMSLSDILTLKFKHLVHFFQNGGILESENMTSWVEEFPIYCDFLTTRIKKAKLKSDLMLSASRCLSWIVHQHLPKQTHFPDIPSQMILREMNDLDLRNLVRACCWPFR